MSYRHRFMITFGLVGLLILAGCVQDPTPESEANKEVVRRFIAETDAKNFAAYNQLLTDDVIAHFPGGVDGGGAQRP